MSQEPSPFAKHGHRPSVSRRKAAPGAEPGLVGPMEQVAKGERVLQQWQADVAAAAQKAQEAKEAPPPAPARNPMAAPPQHGPIVLKVGYDPTKNLGDFVVSNPYRWKPGQSGNPKGRPKILSQAYKEVLAAEDENGVTNAAKIALVQIDKAISTGDTPAAIEIRKATEGDILNIGVLPDQELDERIAQLQVRLAALQSGDVLEGTFSRVSEDKGEGND